MQLTNTQTNRVDQRFGQPVPLLRIVTLFSLILVSCGDLNEYDNSRIESVMRDTLLTTNEIWDVSLLLMERGKRRVILEGDYAIDYNEPNRKETRIEGSVYVQIFDSTNSRVSQAWSDRANYRTKTGEFELFDSVRVSTRDSTHLYTDYLHWSQENDMISTDRFVIITTPDDSLTGTAFRSRSDLTEYTLENSGGQFVVE